MNPIEALVVNKRDLVKGLFVYCKKCDYIIDSRMCNTSGKRISTCKYKDQHVFKAIVAIPGTDGKKRKTRIFNTRNTQEAIRLKFEFDEELIQMDYQSNQNHKMKEISKPQLLIECMTMYVGYLNNSGVESHKIKTRSKGHIAEAERFFKYFCLCLKANQIDHNIFRVDQLNDRIVGMLHQYILNKLGYKNKTYNKFISLFRQFTNWLIDKKGYAILNPFNEVTRRKVTTNNVTMTKLEFEKLLAVITKENGEKIFKNKDKRNLYRAWLPDAFRLALETGLRREEFMTLRFNDIKENEEGELLFIQQDNFKVNRINGIDDNDEGKQVKNLPITFGLRALLTELGYHEKRGSEKFIIAPYESSSRITMIDVVSKAFTHFWSKTGIKKSIQLKNLRKTYITSLVQHFGDKANIISNHSGMDVLKKHYVNQQQLVAGATDFSVFK